MSRVSSDIPSLIEAADQGDASASEALFSALYSELLRAGQTQTRRARRSSDSKCHDAAPRGVSRDGQSRQPSVFPRPSTFHGLCRTSRAWTDHRSCSQRLAQKRGGQFEITSLTTDIGDNLVDARELSRISDALDELAKTDAALAQIVDLKFFCGFSFAEIAAMRGLSERTVQRNWEKARIYLHSSICG